MKPLLDFGFLGLDYSISSYSFFIRLAIFLSLLMNLVFLIKKGVSFRRAIIFLFLILISILAGAKIFHVLLNYNYYLKEPRELLSFDFSGFALYGSFFLSCLSGFLFSRWVKVSPWNLADSLVPAIGVGIAVARVGCFLNGCCFGKPTSLLAGITYPPGSPAQIDQMSKSLTSIFANSLPVFPSQLFELTGALVGVVLSYLFYSKKFKEGSAFLFFAAFFSLIRMVNYFFRQYPSFYSMPPWFYPAFYSLIILICTTLIFKRNNNSGIR